MFIRLTASSLTRRSTCLFPAQSSAIPSSIALPHFSSPFIRSMSSSASANAPGWDPVKNPFPTARREDHIDVYKSKEHGQVKIADPYRWLETSPAHSQETQQFSESQAAFFAKYLEGYAPREAFKERLKQTFSYPRFTCPSLKYDGNFYYNYNSGLESQSRIFRANKKQIDDVEGQSSKDQEAPPGQVFFDANRLSKDGTVALTVLAFSHTGKYFAYGVSKSGSDWFALYFRETTKPFNPGSADEDIPEADKGGANRLPDEIHHVKFSGATWLHDDSGVFYQQFPAPKDSKDLGSETDANKDARLYFHKLGTSQKDDVLICDVDPELRTGMWSTEISDDGKYVMLDNSKDTDPKSRKYVASLEGQDLSKPLKWVCLADKFESDLSYLANDGNTFYFMTNRDAPRYKIVKVTFDPSTGVQQSEVWKLSANPSVKVEDLVTEDGEGALLGSATVLDNDKLLLVYSRNVMDELWQFDLKTGKKVARLLPNLVGSIGQISGKREDSVSFVQTSSFVSPGTITRLEWSGGKEGEQPQVRTHRHTRVKGFVPEDYVSKQEWFTSDDGTQIPMFITYHKDTKLDGTAPAWLYSYGGFQIPIGPTFSPSMLSWVKMYRGVLVFVNARGGGEFGEDWHDAGRRFNKHKTFEDVLSGAKYLHENKYAAKGKIILNGGSNGGLTVAASLNRAKEEHGIGAGVAEVGVLDLLRFQYFTIGAAWISDYLNSEIPEQFDYQRTISPVHNVQERVYPTTLFLCASHDDRVVAAHTSKMVATLQHVNNKNPNPILMRVDLNAGHGAGKSLAKRIDEAADKYSAINKALGLEIKDADDI
ncbi:unnamed protein product [Sympodiomycopsis kandeliae]